MNEISWMLYVSRIYNIYLVWTR